MCNCGHPRAEHVFAAWMQTACWKCNCDEFVKTVDS